MALPRVLAYAPLVAVALLSTASRAADEESATRSKPRTALVLSGGGARGATHIGVLKVLDELHVKPDIVVGTSMGAIVGGLYAAGWTPAEIEQVLLEIEWSKMFVDKPAREDRSFRRKRDDYDFLVQAKLRFKGWKPYLPPSLIGGQRLGLMLHEIERRSLPATDFDALPIPYRAIATDLDLGEAVVIRSGSMADAMRASMAVPAVFAAVEIDGRKLVDGGIVANLPIGVALDLGAERIIAVDISTPLGDENLQSLLDVLGQTNSLLTVLNRNQDVARLRPDDVLLVPDLGDLSFSDFDRAAEAIELGEGAAREIADRLRSFAVDDATWAAFEARREERRAEPPIIDRIRIDNESWVSSGIVEQVVRQKVGQPLDEEQFAEDARNLAGLEYFGPIRSDVRETPEGLHELTIHAPRRPYGRSSLQFGLSLRDDFDTDASYTFALRHLMLAVNQRGGEWATVLQGGGIDVVSTQFYQPLDLKMRWFVSPTIEYRNETRFLWADASPVAEVDLKRLELRADAGRVLGNWGELRAGAYWSDYNVSAQVGSPILPVGDARDGGVSAVFRIDTVDSIQFPRHGAALEAEQRYALDSFGADLENRRSHLIGGYAWSIGRTTLFPVLEVGINHEDDFVIQSGFGAGGWLKLSGLGRDELLGNDMALARLGIYRELAKFDLGALSQRVYVGMSLEAGNAWLADETIDWASLRYGGAVFVGAETVLGPVFLGWGWTEPDRGRFSFILGERF
jgi:NTE family protein